MRAPSCNGHGVDHLVDLLVVAKDVGLDGGDGVQLVLDSLVQFRQLGLQGLQLTVRDAASEEREGEERSRRISAPPRPGLRGANSAGLKDEVQTSGGYETACQSRLEKQRGCCKAASRSSSDCCWPDVPCSCSPKALL